MLRLLTAGESHGPGLTAILDGIPAGLRISSRSIQADLERRQRGYGRGGRMLIERDRAEVRGGVRHGRTLGSPISVWVANLDFERWADAMSVWGRPPIVAEEARAVTRPRPGHADLAGALKFQTHDARNVLERASARETVARVAAGAIVRRLLEALGIRVSSHTIGVGPVLLPHPETVAFGRLEDLPEDSPLRCVDGRVERRMVAEVDAARRAGDTVGGCLEVVATGVPPGLGSVASWDRRLDARLAHALMAIPSVKAVSVGEGARGARERGSRFHDEIGYRRGQGFLRATNRAGGIEGGMSNGEDVRTSVSLKPLSTLPRPLGTVDLRTKKPARAAVERTDTIAIVAAGVIAEAAVAFVLGDAVLEKFGGDTIGETARRVRAWRRSILRY